MQVGDLVQYRDYPEDGYGIVLENNAGYIHMWFTDTDNSDQIWEDESKLEALCK